MQQAQPAPPFVAPTTTDDVLSALGQSGPDAALIAGGTWVMRAGLRHERPASRLISLAHVAGLRQMSDSAGMLTLGCMVTHDLLSRILPDMPDLHGLRQAAAKSANPGVRRLATLGGNLCAASFAAADLVPALLAAGAQVDIATPGQVQTLSLDSFLATRGQHPAPWLLTAVHVPRTAAFSAHARLPMRKAGDYPCAIVSISTRLENGRLHEPKIAVGAVEKVPRRWLGLERALHDAPLDSVALQAKASEFTHEFTPRDAVDAPGWYRLSVLPVLLRRAFETVKCQAEPK